MFHLMTRHGLIRTCQSKGLPIQTRDRDQCPCPKCLLFCIRQLRNPKVTWSKYKSKRNLKEINFISITVTINVLNSTILSVSFTAICTEMTKKNLVLLLRL